MSGPLPNAEPRLPVTCPRRSKIASHAVSQPKRKIFLVDDHPLVRDGLANLIHQQSDLVVCGQADDAVEALSKIGAIKPDLVVVDIHLPGSSGIELIKSIKNAYPHVLT